MCVCVRLFNNTEKQCGLFRLLPYVSRSTWFRCFIKSNKGERGQTEIWTPDLHPGTTVADLLKDGSLPPQVNQFAVAGMFSKVDSVE